MMSGTVCVTLRDPNSDRELILAYLNQGEFFGEFGLFDGRRRRSAVVRAKTKTEVAILDYDKIKSLYSVLPELLFIITGQMARRLCNTSHRIRDLAFVDVKGRVARALLQLSNEPDAMTHPDGMQIKITRQELGHLVGCSREMAGRVLRELDEVDHLVSASGKTIVIHALRAGEAAATEATRPPRR